MTAANRNPIRLAWTGLAMALTTASLPAADAPTRAQVAARLAADYPALEAFYRDIHAHPELSLMESRTAARLAAEWRAAGYEVTEKFGGHGVVGVLRNGAGPVLLLRADMDALPVREETGLPYASTVRVKDLAGAEVPVMHACGHDVHLTTNLGAARLLAGMRERWAGTLILVGQPAEELGVGARTLMMEGLYRKFGRPDWALALHTSATLPAGSVGTIEGFAMANVDHLDVTVRGVGGHGAYPHTTRDPVVLAAKIVLSLQTIVSREIRPIDAAVVTVGSIHGGTKHNIIPDEVKLQLTLRSYSDDARRLLRTAVERICRGEAIASGIPEDRMPVIVHTNEQGATPALYNDPVLTRRVRGAFTEWLGAAQVHTIEPEMGGEDFSQFGRTAEKVPLCLFRLGVVAPEAIAAAARGGPALPSLHSSKFAPVPRPTIVTGVTALTAAALELLARP